MSNYNFSPLPNWQLSDGNGKPYAGGLIYTYEAGGTTPKTTYNDDDTANTNPVVLDSEGRATIKLATGKYRMVFTDGVSAVLFDPTTIEGVLVWDIDNIGQDVQSLRIVGTISDLEDISSGTLTDGDAAIVQGCYTANDGGGGLFVWDSANTSTPATIGGVYIQPTAGGTGRWIRQFVEKVNPRWFGALGDGVTDYSARFAEAITYATAVGLPIVLDYGTYYLGSDPGFTTTGPLVVFNNAVIKWAGFPLNISPAIPVSDANRHFNYTPGADTPVFPADADIKNIWLDGTTGGWYQYTLENTINTLNGAINETLIIQDNGGTWVSGSLKITVNGTEYTQSHTVNKDTSMTELAVLISANADVQTATYYDTYHQIVIIPDTGKTVYATVTTSGLGGGSTVAFNVVRNISNDVKFSGRVIQNAGSVSSTTNLTIPNTGNFYYVTGTTAINLISNVGWWGGSEITLTTDDQFTINHNESASGDYKPIKLLNDQDMVLTAGSNITLKFDGLYWQEIARKNNDVVFVVSSGSFTATFPTAIDATFYYIKYSNSIVKLWWNIITGITSNKTHVASGTPLPASIRPSEQKLHLCMSNGVAGIGLIQYLSFDGTGGMAFYAVDDSTAVTQIFGGSMEYPL